MSYLGNRAGYFETGANKLYLDNSLTTTPLLFEDFEENVLGNNTKQFSNGADKFTLSVNGKVRANEVKVYTAWADYVLEEDYELRSLEEVEAYIHAHGHLPEVPTESEVAEKRIFLGEMNATLLKKIEELTLYTIAQEKAIHQKEEALQNLQEHYREQESLNQELRQRLAALEKKIQP